MGLLKREFKDSEILESAYRTVASRLNESLGPLSQAIPETPKVEQLTGLQLKTLILEYDSEIKHFRDVLTGKLKSRISVVEPPSDNMDIQRARRLEQDQQNDLKTIRRGIGVLEKRRGKLRRRLHILRLCQITVPQKVAEGKRIVEKASQLNTEILKEVQKLKQMLSEMEGLRAKHNSLQNEFQQTNLNPNKEFPPFTVEIPRAMNPEEILTRQALTEPHRTVIDRSQMEQSQIQQLSIALKQQLLKELRENPNEKTV